MSYYTYRYDNVRMGWRRETAFRTTAEGLDTTNGAANTFYSLGIQNMKVKLLRFRRNKVWQIAAGHTDWGSILEGEYEALEWSAEGDLVDLMMIKMLVGAAITNADATTYRTRVYATSTARSAAKPTIQVFQQFINDAAANAQDMNILLVGTQLRKLVITWAKSAPVKATLTFQSAKPIAFTPLNTYPAKLPVNASGAVLQPYHNVDTVVTFAKGGTTYQATPSGGSITYDDGSSLYHGDGESYAGQVLQGFRQISVDNLRLLIKEKAIIDDINGLSSTAASDVDLTVKMSRNTTSDFLQFAFQKLLAQDGTFEEWHEDYHLLGLLNLKLKPASYETGAVLTITQADSFAVDDARVVA